MSYQTVIGLEVHVQLNTQSKIFCACSTENTDQPNKNVCPICCGYPGVLPVFNLAALKLGIRAGLALNCKINPRIYFERKSYFYPDLPKNYQISQYQQPLGEQGFLLLPSGKKIGIERVHLEEDAGKLIHQDGYSLVDLNRAGTPLLEIVSHPDIDSPEQAYQYLYYLKLILQYAAVSSCDMEHGSLRCDANISLKKPQDQKLGTKVELKNMNSFRGVRDGLTYEVARQTQALASGEKINQETRLWDTQKLKTCLMRSKEEAHDYRYFPDPDLLDFSVPQEFILEQKEFIGENPLAKKERFMQAYSLPEKEALVFIEDIWLADFFEAAVKCFNRPDKISGWLLGPFLEQLNLREKATIKLSPKNFARIIELFCNDKLNNQGAKKAINLAFDNDLAIDSLVEQHQLLQVSDSSQLSAFIDAALKENPNVVKDYLAGKAQSIMFLVGQVMKKSQGKANPQLAKKLLEQSIKGGKHA